MFYINSRYHWAPDQIVDMKELARLTIHKRCGESNLMVISGAIWLTGIKAPSGCSEVAAESGDWLFEAGEMIPHWILKKQKGVVASALGWLIIEAAAGRITENLPPLPVIGRVEEENFNTVHL